MTSVERVAETGEHRKQGIFCNTATRRRGRKTVLPAVIACLLLGTGDAAAQAYAPGDGILGYRLIETRYNPHSYWQWDLRFEVYYTYNRQHPSVLVGGVVAPDVPGLYSGHSYWGAESGPAKAVEERAEGNIVRGTQRVRVAVRSTVGDASTTTVRFFLYEPMAGEFLSRAFPFPRRWPAGGASNLEATSARPDLVILKAERNDIAGQRYLVVTVRNQGQALAQGADGSCSYQCRSTMVTVSNQSFLQGTYLVPGKEVTGMLAIAPCPDPVMEFSCKIDSGNTINESNELNNTLTVDVSFN